MQFKPNDKVKFMGYLGKLIDNTKFSKEFCLMYTNDTTTKIMLNKEGKQYSWQKKSSIELIGIWAKIRRYWEDFQK